MTRRPRRSSRLVTRLTAAAAAAAMTAGVLTAVTVTAAPAGATTARASVINAASAYAKARGYKVGIAVYDTKTGHVMGNNLKKATFASESVIKVMIAARLILQGRMHGSTSARAKRMIACSNDNIANSFYGSVGGDSLLGWTKKRFKVPTLGSGPIRGNWWGSNRITADGMVRLYAKLKADKRIGPWLLRAMHAHTKRGCDGFYQAFGLPQAASRTAVKQGWGSDYSYRTPNASMNSTGFVNGDRYAIAILARGKASSYGTRLGNIITGVAKRLLPGRAFPSGRPVVTGVSVRVGLPAGGNRIYLTGREFTAVRSVTFSGTKARYTVRSDRSIIVLAPRRPAGAAGIQVNTQLGRSTPVLYTYRTPPAPKPVAPPTTAPPTTAPPAPPTTSGATSTAPAARTTTGSGTASDTTAAGTAASETVAPSG